MKITVVDLKKRFEGKNLKLGESFVYLDKIINEELCPYETMDLEEIVLNKGLNLGYEIVLPDEILSQDDLRGILALLYQESAERGDTKFNEIIDNKNVIIQYVYGNGEGDTVVKHLRYLMSYCNDNDSNHLATEINDLIETISQMPLKQLDRVRVIMRDYMFKVDKSIFGLQTNDSATCGYMVDEEMIAYNKGFAGYDYSAFINRSMNKEPARNVSIAILFKFNKESDIVNVDFKAERDKYVSEDCVAWGPFIGDFGSITIDITDTEKSQALICEKLNEYMKRLVKLIEEHPYIDTIMGQNDVSENFGQI